MDVYSWLLIIVLMIGTLGTFVPMVPGMWLIFVALVAYGIFDHWTAYSIWYIVVVFILTVFSSFLDFGGAMIGAKKFGASNMATFGTIVGSVAGGLLMQLPGTIIGGIIGAVLAEYKRQRSLPHSLRAAAGSLIGSAIGSTVQLVIALTITIYTIFRLRGVA